MILVYPVITFAEDCAYSDGIPVLLGENPGQEKIDFFSSEKQVTAQTPPTYLTHASDDTLVPVENSILFYQALLKNNIPAEMHLVVSGDHGFTRSIDQYAWFNEMRTWMTKIGILTGNE